MRTLSVWSVWRDLGDEARVVAHDLADRVGHLRSGTRGLIPHAIEFRVKCAAHLITLVTNLGTISQMVSATCIAAQGVNCVNLKP